MLYKPVGVGGGATVGVGVITTDGFVALIVIAGGGYVVVALLAGKRKYLHFCYYDNILNSNYSHFSFLKIGQLNDI